MVSQLRELISILEEIQEKSSHIELRRIISVYDEIEKTNQVKDVSFILTCVITAICLEERIMQDNNQRLKAFCHQLSEQLKSSNRPVSLPPFIYERFFGEHSYTPTPSQSSTRKK